MNLTQTSNIPVIGPGTLIQPYSAKSSAPGTPLGNIGVTQDLSELGLDAVIGIGFVTTAGAAADFRQVPQSNGTNTALLVLNTPIGIGVNLTDRLSVGAATAFGISYYDGPTVGVGGMTPDYALRGTLGANYEWTDTTTIGGYYQTEQKYTYDNAFQVDFGNFNTSYDVHMDLPQNLGFGIANTSLMDGRLLLGADVLYKLWDDAAMYEAVYDNQWVLQFGTQLTQGRFRWRAGYVWAENPVSDTPGLNLGGVVPPGGLPAIRYAQALLAVTSQHRMSLGVGMVDVLPGVDFDMMGGGMFYDSEQLGQFTTSSIESYWLGFGLTWRFRRGSCERLCVPDTWGGVDACSM
jgi:long-chain fatty acid transport protein